MLRYLVFAVGILALAESSALAQTQPPNSTTLCPITHNCRPVGQGAQVKRIVPAPPPVGTISCPPGTYQIPNTNRCRVS